jgi:2-phospho-L-lactate guanylyltransferase
VIAFLADTVQAARHCPAVRTVTVVTDDPAAAHAARRAGADSFSPRLPHPGLNRDLTAFARSRTDDHPFAVLLADLPALTTAELTAALIECSCHPTAFASDQQETGTTLLYSQQASRIRPEFGKRSAHRHHTTGAHPLTHVGPGLRRDVDTLTDLHAAQSLGVGTHTAAEITAHQDLLFPDLLQRHRLLNDERRAASCPT